MQHLFFGFTSSQVSWYKLLTLSCLCFTLLHAGKASARYRTQAMNTNAIEVGAFNLNAAASNKCPGAPVLTGNYGENSVPETDAPAITNVVASPGTVCIGQPVTVTVVASLSGVTGSFAFTLINENNPDQFTSGVDTGPLLTAELNTGQTSYRYETLRLIIQANSLTTSQTFSYIVRLSNYADGSVIYFLPGEPATIFVNNVCPTGQWAFSTGVTATSLVVLNPVNGAVISATCTESAPCPLQATYTLVESVVPVITGDRKTCPGSALSLTISCPVTNNVLNVGSIPGTYSVTDAGSDKIVTLLGTVPAGIYYLNPVCMGGPYPISLTVVEPPLQYPPYLTNDGVITCGATSVTISPNAYPVDSYTLLPGGQTAVWGGQFVVNTPQTYTLLAEHNGCFSQTVVQVTQNSTLPVISLTAGNSGVISCAVPWVTLTATVSNSTAMHGYAFSGPNLTASNIVAGTALAGTAGTYSVTATNYVTGCSSVTSLSVSANTNPPDLLLSLSNSGTITCASPALTLTASGAASYTFSGPGIVSSYANQAVISLPGNYTVIAGSVYGCFTSQIASVFANTVVPAISSFTASGTLSCAQTNVVLTTNTTYSGPLTYSFYGPGQSGSPGIANTTTVNQPGTYQVTVRANSGCSASATVGVTADASFTATAMSVQLAGSLSTGGPVTLTAQLSGATGYTLTGPAVGIATAPDGVFSVNLPGLYTISAINQGGCTITGTASVLPAEPPLIPDTFEPTNMLTLSLIHI